jgi:hypothetical protein
MKLMKKWKKQRYREDADVFASVGNLSRVANRIANQMIFSANTSDQEKQLVDKTTLELRRWLDSLEKTVEVYFREHYENLQPPKFKMEVGPRYIRIIKQEGPGRSAHAFIRRDNGDILKPASWKTPAKHARGNIFSADGGRSAFGRDGFINYLK